MAPRRWTTAVRKWVYRYLVARDGERCYRCQAVPPPMLDIHHVDGNPKNDDPLNLVLACGPCNKALQSPRMRAVEAMRDLFKPVSRGGAPRERDMLRSDQTQLQPGAFTTSEPAGHAARPDPLNLVTQGSPEYQASSLYEPIFRDWVVAQVRANSSLSLREAVNSGAEYTGCSPQTTRRYLEKLVSSLGPLAIVADMTGEACLVLKPERTNPPLPS